MFAKVTAGLIALVLTGSGFVAPAQAAVAEAAYTAISAQTLWNQGFTGADTSVAFIDQGLNLNHEYFRDQVIDGFCYFEASTSSLCPNGTKRQTGVSAASQRIVNGFPLPEEFHGNMVAGIVAGVPNASAPGGVAPDSKIVMANVDLSLDAITAAAQYVLDNAVTNKTVALSLSFGGLFEDMPRSWLQCDSSPGLVELADIFSQLRSKGILTFASAGNTPTLDIATSIFPSCLKEVVAVGSVNQLNEVSWYVTMSKKIELLAPDYAVSAGTLGYMVSSGTSAAAPLAAGSFALLRQAFPSASAELILAAMKNTGTPIDDVIRQDIPMVNLQAAYNALAAGTVDVPGKITIGSYKGYVAIYTKGYEGKKLTAKVAGVWLKVDPITLVPGKTYSLTKRMTGAGYQIAVEVYIDGVLLKSESVLTK
ncbi:MAG: S8/S53 family peptidase [Aquiluna sp.]|nr:S8/S53 family peptidase [Aquiluna sp.]MCF8545823.1 S8/S53 family peptidase [Aquiluna sp.]